MNAKKTLLNEIADLLSYHRMNGIEGYPTSDGALHFLRLRDNPAPAVPTVRKNRVPTYERKVVEKETVSVKATLPSVKGLDEQVARCTLCELAASRVCPVFGRGGQGRGIRLMVVGDWLLVDKGGTGSAAIFGHAEDEMLNNMFKAIHLEWKDVFVTNVIKCGIPRDVQPRAEHMAACTVYLQRQIEALAPTMICGMGPVATRTLCNLRFPLSRLRGRFHQYKVNDNLSIPLMVTYHPSYLLANQEMKRATWMDLQMIEKKLREAASA